MDSVSWNNLTLLNLQRVWSSRKEEKGVPDPPPQENLMERFASLQTKLGGGQTCNN